MHRVNSVFDKTAPSVPPDAVWVTYPKDRRSRLIIDSTAALVKAYGPQAERHLIALSLDDRQPRALRDSLAFLSQPDDADHVYYMWRVYSLMQGDTLDKWDFKTFNM